jgi:tetratricopeptide (TPR) repeat protein
MFSEAVRAYQANDFEATVELCDALLQAVSPKAEVLNLKAITLQHQGYLHAAKETIDQALELAPDTPTILYHAAFINKLLMRIDSAVKHAREACRRMPGKRAYRYQLAHIHLVNRDYQICSEIAQQLLQDDPAFIEAMMLLAQVHSERQENEDHKRMLERIISVEPGHARALAALSDLDKSRPDDAKMIKKLQNIRAGTSDITESTTATFALADIYRRAGGFRRAFDLYHNANDRLADRFPFDAREYQQKVDEIVSRSAEFFKTNPRTGEQGAGLVFITGMPRSGTSLCEQVVSAHPDVLGCGELLFMEQLERELEYRGLSAYDQEGVRALNETGLDRLRKLYTDGLPVESAEFRLVTDKAPKNFERIGLICRLFPRARFLWCTRHPLDTIISCFFKDFHQGQNFSYKLGQTARVYASHVRLMRHWQRLFPGRILEVQYPEMVRDIEKQARIIAEFLRLEFDSAMTEPHRNPRAVRTASGHQVRKPVYDSAIDVWRHYQEELQPVIRYLRQENLLGDMAHTENSDSD